MQNQLQQKQVRDLSEEEKQLILMTENFQDFFDKSSRIIERALSEQVDLFVDYTGASETKNTMQVFSRSYESVFKQNF